MKKNTKLDRVYNSLNIYGILVGTICFFISYLFALITAKISTLFFVGTGIYLFIYFFKSTKCYLNSRGIFSAVWFGTIGLACLQLHPLQINWNIKTWICLWLAYICFLVGYEIHSKYSLKLSKKYEFKFIEKLNLSYFTVLIMLIIIIIVAFIADVIYSREIPIFSNDMSSYVKFGLPYIHYLTVSCALIAPLTIYYFKKYNVPKKQRIALVILNIFVGSIPVLIVSRQLLLLEIIISIFTYLKLTNTKKIKIKYVIICLFILALSWSMLSIFRNQNNDYLRIVLGLQEVDYPLTISQWRTYLYVTFNFDNFNYNVINLSEFSYGARMLYPFFTLVGVKIFFPRVIATNSYLKIMDTFNTYPILMEGYSDFGVWGVVIYLILIGYFVAHVERKSEKGKNDFNVIAQSIINYSLIFSFFTSFFAITTTWVYLIILFVFNFVTRPSIELGEDKKASIT